MKTFFEKIFFALVMSVILLGMFTMQALDKESVVETNNCIQYHKEVNNYWWSDKPEYTVDYDVCGQEKIDLLKKIKRPKELWG